jgi:hypothetical protein
MSPRLLQTGVLKGVPPALAGEWIAWAAGHAVGRDRMRLLAAALDVQDLTTDCRLLPMLDALDDASLQELVANGRSLADAIISESRRGESVATRLGIRLASLLGDPRLIEVVADGIRAADPDRTAAAGEALISIAWSARCDRRAAWLATNSTAQEEDRAAIEHALVRLLRDAEMHRRDEPAMAAALLAHHARFDLASVMDRDVDRVDAAIRRVVRRGEHGLIRAMAVRFLGERRVSRAAVRAIESASDADRFERWLAESWLLRAPARRRAMRTVIRPAALVPHISAVIRMPAVSQRGYAAWIDAVPLSPASRAERLAEAASLPDGAARRQAARSLAHRGDARSLAAIAPFALDADASVATLAACAILAPGTRRQRMLHGFRSHVDRAARSPHAIVARLARFEAACRDASRFFTAWYGLPDAARRVAARRVAQHDAAEFALRLREVLVRGGREDRLGGMDLVRRLRWSDRVELELLEAAASSDAHVAAAAIATLAVATTDTARQALRAALRHADGRVRANAAEAIARRRDAESLALIEPFLGSRHARLRANAVVAFVRDVGGGFGPLAAMLQDADPRHRRSAAWAAGRSVCTEAADLVRRLARNDESADVRQAAERSSRLLATCPPASGGAAT